MRPTTYSELHDTYHVARVGEIVVTRREILDGTINPNGTFARFRSYDRAAAVAEEWRREGYHVSAFRVLSDDQSEPVRF